MTNNESDFDQLILSGAIEPAGIDENTGEMLYNFTTKLKDVSPTLYREVNNMFNSHIMKFWELGMVSMDVTSYNPVVKLTPKAFNLDLMELLDKEEFNTLEEIKRNLIRW